MRRTAVLPLLLLALPARAFHGLALSLGPGRPVCAKVTFDRKTAESGGHVFVLDAASEGDEQAIRMSEAVIARRGGLSSRAAAAARRHSVPAVALGQGRWDGRGPALYLDEPTYGAPQTASGYTFRPVTGSEERALREGDAVIVDAASGGVVLVPPAEAETRVAAADAARAYDGLRDVQALEQWLVSTEGAGRGAALLLELVPRAVAGAMPADDLGRARRAAERSVPASAREDMRRAEALAFARAAREAKGRAEDCSADAADAADAAALERLADEARASADGVAAVARMLSLSDGGAAAAARGCREAALRRAKSRAAKTADFVAAAASGGADRPEGAELPEKSWERFAESNGLTDWLARTLDDSSLGLRRKSDRIRERIAAAKLDPASPAGSAARALAAGPVLVVGEDAALKAAGPADVLERVKEVWAASWTPGPLGARQRAGRGLAYEGRVRIEKLAAADASGLVFSRDPGSGRRERLIVEAAPGSLDAILDGDAPTESYALDRRTGRELAPRSGSAASVLSAERLARVARLARALDAWKGGGVEVAFSFTGERLIAHHARSLEPPRPVLPLNDPFAPRPDAEFLNIRPVGR
jgi:phosphohistidine swiveling domain-containing protein